MTPSRAVRWAVGAGALVLAPLGLAQPLPCEPARPGDGQPWVHDATVIDSFPRLAHAPEAIGEFLDAGGSYWLSLWRDDQGFFGQLASPVLEADSPASRLHDLRWDANASQLQFTARPGGVEIRISGILSGTDFRITEVTGASTGTPVLRRHAEQPSMAWASRAQFECAMALWRRR